jgi:WD40 repeat protein
MNLQDEKIQLPKNFEEAMDQIHGYINKQLPLVIDVEFIPICFDITKDVKRLVIGGQHGNLAIFDLENKKLAKDIELISKSIVAVNFAKDDTMVIAATENLTLFFLEFPSFYLLHTVNLQGHGIIIKVGIPSYTAYICDHTTSIHVIDLNDDEFKETTLSHINRITHFDISKDSSMLAFGLETGSIQLFHTETQVLLQNTPESPQTIEILKFSENIKLIAACFNDFSIKVWNIDIRMSLKHYFQYHTGSIRGLAFVKDNRYLISGSLDKKIIMFDMKIDSVPYYFELFDSEVLCFRTSPSCDKLYFSQDMNKLMIWEIPHLGKNVRYKKHLGNIKKLIFIPNSFDLLSISEDGLVVLWDYQSDSYQESLKIEGGLITGIVSSKAQFAFLSSGRPSLVRLNLYTFKYYDYDINSAAVSMRFSSDENLLAIGDELFRIIIFDSVIMERKYIIKGHTGRVTEIYFLDADNFVITSSLDTKVMKWENSTSNKIFTLDAHKAPINCMVVTKDETLAVTGSADSEIIVWSLTRQIMISKIALQRSLSGTRSLFLSNDKSYLIALQDKMLNYWELRNVQMIFQQETLFSAQTLGLSLNEKIMAVGEENTIFIEENPLICKHLKVVGKKYGSMHKFMNYIDEVTSKKVYRIRHLDIYNGWMFTPFRIGIAHILAYINKNTQLNSALLDLENKASFCTTIEEDNPLSISVNQDHKSCIEVCLKYLKFEFSKGNTLAYTSLANCLTKITELDIPSIPRLYDTLFQQSKSLHLPAFCVMEKTQLPSLCHSDEFLVSVEKLLTRDSMSSHGGSIIFYHSLCPLHLDLGTEGSISFLQSLLNSSYREIFRSKLLNVLLRDKWERINWAIYAQGLLYILYLIQLSIFCVFFSEGGNFLISLFVVHVLLMLYEIVQIVTDFYDYWRDMWNILDQLRGISFTIFCYMIWQGDNDKNVLLTVIIFSWTRGISYFRMFEGTRYMVRLLSEVITDMQVFFVILSYSTLAFTFVLFLNNDSNSFYFYLTRAYRINLSDFEEDYKDFFDWIIFFFVTMINPLIMLNLLVSIMANTYKRVKDGNDIANYQELTEMVLEIEKLMFWKRNCNQQKYLQQCVSLTSVDSNEGIKALERLKVMRKHVLKIEKTLHVVSSEINQDQFLNLKCHVDYIRTQEESVSDLLKQNQETLNNTNELLIKLSKELNINIP